MLPPCRISPPRKRVGACTSVSVRQVRMLTRRCSAGRSVEAVGRRTRRSRRG
jgi:hypothetical protein